MRENIISFTPMSKEAKFAVEMPQPARHSIPQWYKDMPAFIDNKLSIDPINGKANTTQKMCLPFADAFNFGYIQKTWCDIMVEQDDDGIISYYFSSGPRIIEDRIPSKHRQYGEDFYNIEFVWKSQWTPRVPKGYSILYTHPLNHEDLPFFTMSGVVDSDKFFYENQANHPFLIKNGFTGIIPQGTPMFQIIPFKRDNWKSVEEDFDPDTEFKAIRMQRKFWGVYKSDFWTKKTFK